MAQDTLLDVVMAERESPSHPLTSRLFPSPQIRGLTSEQIASLRSADPVQEPGMPLGPGSLASILRLGKRLPDFARQLRGLFQAKPPSTAPTNTLRDLILRNKPANLSRRSFFTSPLQTAVDIPQALREIGVPERSIKSGDEIGWWPELAEKGTIFSEMSDPVSSVDVGLYGSEPGRVIDPLIETGYRPTPYEGPEGTVLRELETMGRVYRDQILKEAAEEAGRTFQEEKDIERDRYEQPGAVAQEVEEIRRRYGR